MSAYKKGYRFELRVKKYLESHNAYLIRSAKSHGAYDLIAIKAGSIYGIQCRVDGKISNLERAKLIELYNTHRIIPILAYRKNRKLILLNLLNHETIEQI